MLVIVHNVARNALPPFWNNRKRLLHDLPTARINMQPLKIHSFLNINLNIKLMTTWRYCNTLTHFIRLSVLDFHKRTHSQERLRCRAVKRLVFFYFCLCNTPELLQESLCRELAVKPRSICADQIQRKQKKPWSVGSSTDVISARWRSRERDPPASAWMWWTTRCVCSSLRNTEHNNTTSSKRHDPAQRNAAPVFYTKEKLHW